MIVLERLAFEVGGVDILADLDAAPLPDEPFDWSGVPEAVRTPLAEVLHLTDGACTVLLDVEYRTACRRFLHEVATREAAVLADPTKAARVAAATCWVIGKTNDTFRPATGRLSRRDHWVAMVVA